MKESLWKKSLSAVLALLIVSCNLFVQPFENGIITSSAKDVNQANDETPENSSISIDNTDLIAGDTLSVINPANYLLKYYVDDQEVETDSFVLSEDYYEKWITVKAFNSEGTAEEPVSEAKVYFSNLPVIYINTDDGKPITTKTDYKSATMNIQSNIESEKPEYNGDISIKGRGNSSWGWPKKPYRIKLDNKADLFGMGENKNWVLIANYLDECFLRNKTAYDLSKELGLESMDCVWTEVVLNGEYAGNYLLCEQIRIDKTRINIFDWESEAKDAAKSIVKAEKEKGIELDQDALEEQMKADLSWITAGSVTFNGQTYNVSKEYDDITGGFLFELSNEYDESSKFTTKSGLKIMLNSPEYLNTNQTMMDYAERFWNDFEKAYRSEDGYVDTLDGRKHYTELADIDSMVSYWLVMEIMGNNDAVYKSRYAYKDLDSKLMFGPVWDFDWGCASSRVSTEPTGWILSTSSNVQAFYKEFLDDPLFIAKATEKYWKIRPYLEEIIKDNGILDTNINYLRKSGAADEIRWNRRVSWSDARGFENDAAVFKNYLCNRIKWLDTQFSSDQQLLNSTYTRNSSYPYTRSADKISFAFPNASDDTFTVHAQADAAIKTGKDVIINTKVDDNNTTALDVYVNGLYYNTFEVINKTVDFNVPNSLLTELPETKNVISVIGKNSNKNTTYKNFCTITQIDSADEIIPEFKESNLTLSGQIGVNFYLDLSSLTDAEKNASFMEFTVNGKTTKDTFDETCKNQTGDFYGFTCNLTSVQMADTIKAVYHYGNKQKVEKTYSILDYINKVESNSKLYDENTLTLVHSIADYGYYVQPWLAANNNWTVGTDHAQMEKHYVDSYDFNTIKSDAEKYKRVLDLGTSDIEMISYSLSLQTETTLNVFVKPKENYTGDAAIKITKDGEATSFTAVKQSDGRYLISIPNISAHHLGETYVITTITANGTATCSLSALSYVYAVLNSGDLSDSDNSVQNNAVSALYKYYAASVKYMNNK